MMTKVEKLMLLSISSCLFAPGYGQETINRMTLEDVIKKRLFSSKITSGIHPLKDGCCFCQVKKDSLNVYDYLTGGYIRTIVTSSDLVPKGDTVPLPISSFEMSDDETRILFSKDEESIYRYSTKAIYYIYDIGTKALISLASGGKQRLATFSPDGNKVAFVRDNNLFIVDVATRLAGTGSPDRDPVFTDAMQITTDGKINEIINGTSDWVYEEEFGFTKAFFWSPDSKKIAYYRFDESNVRLYTLEYYDDTYPELYTYKYPKAGEDNSLCSIWIYDLDHGETIPVDLGPETDIYIPRIKWTNDPGILAFYRMNRHQNKLELILAKAASGETRTILTETNQWYIEVTDDWTFLKDGKSLLLTSERDGYNHIYLYNLEGIPIRQLTSGPWEVTSLYGVDEATGNVYFQADYSSPVNREVMVVSLDGTGMKILSGKEGFNRAAFNRDFTLYMNYWSDINTPPFTTLNRADGEVVRTLETNDKLNGRMKEYDFSHADFFTFMTKDSTDLNGWMMKPPNFDPERKYPVLFVIYGGPGSQTVINRWGSASAWNQYIAHQGIIVVSVDNRGTGGRGQAFKKCTYLQLGKFETSDQIEAAEYLGTLSYVDKSRIGIWGWSFGGYLTLSCLTRGSDFFSMGVAVAPVTNWRYYDNIYTERFMRTPVENLKGYEDNSPVNHAGKLKGKLLIIHGMADDNVHPQNTYDMVSALVDADKQFELQLYPNSNHGIYEGKNTTWHNYRNMTDFIVKHLTDDMKRE